MRLPTFCFLFTVSIPLVAASDTALPAKVAAVLKQHCWECHLGKDAESGLRLDSMEAVLRGGESGERVIAPGAAEQSYLIQRILAEDAAERMPPDEPPLDPAAVSTLKSWINNRDAWKKAEATIAAETVDHWSLQPLPHLDTTQGGIDQHIHAELAKHQLKPSERARRETLIRRLYLVMHGLPPTIEETHAFVNDSHPDAWPRLVEKALSSPRYGERWAAHWLDLVRFGETHGFETNRERPNAWHYRDWVIRSLNEDKPYDQFLVQQLAGDQLGEPIGTSFLVAGPYDIVKGQDKLLRLMQRQDELADIINTTGTAMLGLTIGCARCHNHKFDPISQQDYYAWQAVFAGVGFADRDLPPPAVDQAAIDRLQDQIKGRRQHLQKFRRAAPLAFHLLDDVAATAVVEHLAKPRGEGVNPAGAQRGHRDDQGDEHRMPNISKGRYTWWDNHPGADVIAYRPSAAGRYRLWLSWGCGHSTHTTDARYSLDADGDLSTTEDRREIARVDQQRFAPLPAHTPTNNSRQSLPKLALWSGLLDAGIHDLTASSAIVVSGGDHGTAISSDVILLEPLRPPAEAGEPLGGNEAAAGNSPSPILPSLRVPVSARHNVERFPPTPMRFVRFTIQRSTASQPCIDELEIYCEDENLALASAGAKATSGGDFVHALHKLEHINDGQYGNPKSWIAAQATGGWVQIELPREAAVDRIEWARDRDGKYADRLAVDYRIEGSLLATGPWQVLASSADRLPVGTPKSEAPTYDFAKFPKEAEQGRAWLRELVDAEAELKRLTTPVKAFAGTFAQPGPTHRLYRGEPTSPRELVGPNTIAKLGDLKLRHDAKESERRLQLARWIASPDNPLTARVIVNRVWQFHFGSGLVATPSDFGGNGTPPTHPELLDWLAVDLIANGWSLKHLHRRILHTATWQQSNAPRPKALDVDAGNRLLWRFGPRRLEAEGIRDCTVFVSGALNNRMGGPGFSAFEVQLENVRHYFPKKKYGPEDWRRMIYMTKVRQEKDSVFGPFDCPDASQVVPKRSQSTTPLQALSLLNSEFVLQQAALLGQRLTKKATPDEQVVLAYELCYQRAPSTPETQAAVNFISGHGITAFARAILNSNEFVFIP